jgi:hypothetical protein
MTRASWAERKVDAVDWADRDVIKVLSATLGLTADEAHILAQNDEFFALTMRIRAEHKRAVRVVKKEIKWQAARIAEEQQAHNADGEAIHNYALLVVHDILAALQKGRT